MKANNQIFLKFKEQYVQLSHVPMVRTLYDTGFQYRFMKLTSFCFLFATMVYNMEQREFFDKNMSNLVVFRYSDFLRLLVC